MTGEVSGADVPRVLADAGENDTDVYALGLRESADDVESWSLMFMECYDEEDQQQIDLGMDTYCLVVDPGQATAYGGVRECELAENGLRLLLADETAGELGVPTHLEFTLDLDDEQLAIVRRGLDRVLTSGRADARPTRLSL